METCLGLCFGDTSVHLDRRWIHGWGFDVLSVKHASAVIDDPGGGGYHWLWLIGEAHMKRLAVVRTEMMFITTVFFPSSILCNYLCHRAYNYEI